MIRTAWFLFVAALATSFFGLIAFVAVLLRHRGDLYGSLTRIWAKTLMWAGGSRVRVHGFEGVDWSRPQVVVCNHTGAFEILALAVTIPVPCHFVVKKELERIPVFGPAWKLAGHISIDRENLQKAIASLRRASDIIHADGGVVIIFPEGTRSRTGDLQPFRKGAFLLALEAAVPILPTIVLGSERITPPGVIRVTAGVLDLHFGAPVPIEGYSRASVDDLLVEVRSRMQAMLDEQRGAAVA